MKMNAYGWILLQLCIKNQITGKVNTISADQQAAFYQKRKRKGHSFIVSAKNKLAGAQ